MDIPPLAFEKPTPKNEKKISKSFLISSDKNNKYNVLLENSENKLNIYAEIETNSGEKNTFQNQYSLIEIRKEKLFLAYDTIEECISEIFNFLDINKGKIIENDTQLKLIIPLNSKKYPEIIFNLFLKEKSDSEKIKELYSLIKKLNEEKNNQKLEIEKLKNEQKELLFYDVKILGITEETKGISIGISFLEEQFYNILDIGKEFNENHLLFSLNMNVKDIKKMNEIEKFFEDNKEIMSNLFKKSDKDFIKLRKIENKIFFDLMVHIYQRRDIDVIDFITKIVHINVFKNIKINLNSNFKVGYFF